MMMMMLIEYDMHIGKRFNDHEVNDDVVRIVDQTDIYLVKESRRLFQQLLQLDHQLLHTNLVINAATHSTGLAEAIPTVSLNVISSKAYLQQKMQKIIN